MISIREIVRGALTRVLPASAGLMAAMLLLPMLGGASGLSPYAPLIAAWEVTSLTVGYAVVLLGFRRRIHPSADVTGRRAIVVGLTSPLALLVASAFAQGAGRAEIAAVSAAVGGLITLGMFFPWLTPRPGGRLRGDDASPESLTDGSVLDEVAVGGRTRERTPRS